MGKLANIATTVVFALVLAGPALVLACEGVGIQLPAWATAEQARYLSGANDEAQALTLLSYDEFASGHLQQALGEEVNQRIPFKAHAMLGNAGLQRSAIALANAPFGYPAYPTFFGSTRLHLPLYDAVTYLPYRRSEDMLQRLEDFGRQLVALQQRNPHARFVICLVQGYQEPAANPAYDLVSNPAVPHEYAERLAQAVAGAEGVLMVSEDYQMPEDYFADFFRSDHHWNHLGVERAYNHMAPWLGKPQFEVEGERTFGDYLYTGATARWGLDAVAEEVSDTAYEFTALETVSADGQKAPFGRQAFLERTDPGKPYYFYDSYYGEALSQPNLAGSGEGRLLVIGNSFASALVPYLAQNYAYTTNLPIIHPSAYDPDARLEEMLATGGYDDVVIVANPTDMVNFAAGCPDFLDGVE